MYSYNRYHKFIYMVFAALAAVQAGFALFQYQQIPGDASDTLILGFSPGRLALMSVPAGVVLLALWVFFAAPLSYYGFVRVHQILQRRLSNSLSNRRILFTALLTITVSIVLIQFTTWEAIVERLRPLLWLISGIAVQSVLFASLLARGIRQPSTLNRPGFFNRDQSLMLAVFLAGCSLFWGSKTIIQRIGPDIIGWNTTGTPVMDIDLLITLVFIGLALFTGQLWRRLRGPNNTSTPKYWDLTLFFILWATAAFYWSSIPVQPSWYLAGPAAPNFEFTPVSDALVYDLTAQNMLIGEGLRSNAFDDIVVRRPFYTFFLGVLRTIAGQDYPAVVFLQAIILSILPAVVYLVTKKLGGRFAGVVAALIILLQGGTAIKLSSVITVSHAKLLMTDLPSAVGVAIFMLLVLPWVHEPGPSARRKRLILAGGVLGALVMIRLETALLLPISAIFAWFAAGRKMKPVLPGTLLVFVGLILFISPWLNRNYNRTGKIYIEVPGDRISFLVNRLFGPSTQTPQTPKVDPRLLLQETGASAGERIASHFLHSNIQSMLIFPSTIRLGDAAIGYVLNRDSEQFLAACCDGEDYVRRLPFWQWYKWDLEFQPENLVLVVLNILLFSIGLVLAGKKIGWAGLLPFAYSETHMLVNAIARTSGGRYLQPVEWIWITYYAIGLLFAFMWVVRLLKPFEKWPAAVKKATNAPESEPPWQLILPAVLVLAFGALLPVGEWFYPMVFGSNPPREWVRIALTHTNLERMEDSVGGVVLHGRGLYFRYFSAGEADPDTLFPNLYVKPFDRMTFFVAGPTSSGVLLRLDAFPDQEIPTGEDVMVIGCRVDAPQGSYTEAALVYFPDLDLLLTTPVLTQNSVCPLP